MTSSLIMVSAQANLSRGSTSQKKWSMWLELQNGRVNVKLACRMELCICTTAFLSIHLLVDI